MTPGVDPSSTAYRVHAYAFNTLTTMLAADDRFIPLSVREAITGAIVEVIEPLIRADDAEQVRLAREDRDQLRKRVLDLAAEFERDSTAGFGLPGMASAAVRLRQELDA